jgi:hypothetical protein
LFSKLLAKSLRVYIKKDIVDLSEVSAYKQVVDINKMILYNVQSYSEPTENVCDNVYEVQY